LSFIEELKRRNVFRVGVAYGISAWVLLQVLDLVLDNTEAPDWIMDVFMIVVLLGFVVALVIAWAYEMTPEGIKKESDVDRSSSVTHETSKKLDKITLVALGVVVVLMLADRLIPEEAPPPTPTTAVQIQSEEPVDNSEAEVTLAKGIAVLPFSNLSEDTSNAFFAGGVHEDVLTNLSRIADLRVISRTSMIKIAEQGLDIREIGKELGVSHVLEGSVRRAGDQVRVTVQLIDASNDDHLWADNFDRKLDDIFAIQSEIAQKIASQLEVEMSPEQARQMAEAPTQNLEAYDLYQQAREMNRVWLDAEGFRQQIPLLEKAISLDPQFRAAQINLVAAYGRMVWTNSDLDWPDGADRDLARARYTYTIERDYEKALELYLKVLPHQPGNSELLLAISSCYKRLAQFDLGLPVIDRAISLDPQHSSIHGERAYHLLGNHMSEEALLQSEEALLHFREGIEKFPDDLSGRYNLAIYSMREAGDLDTFFEQMKLIEQLGPQSVFLDDQYFRLKMPYLDLDSVLETLNESRDEGLSWRNMSIDHQASELLGIAGRQQDSTARAKNALSTLQDLLSSGQSLPGNSPKLSYALFAKIACMANDRAAFNQNQSVFRALKATELGNEYYANQLMAFALAECGDIQAGWGLMEKALHPALGYSEWEVVLDPIYAHYFSDIPEFQAMVEKKNTEKAASE
jgi:TolB-like protein